MGVASALASVLLAQQDRFGCLVRTLDARRAATIGAKTKVLRSGRVINISGVPDRLKIGSSCVIAGQVLVFAHAGRITMGDWVFVGEGSHLWSSSDLQIGNRVLISHNVEIHDTESHPLDPAARFAQTREIFTKGHPKQIEGIRTAPVRIGDDVWIGFGATIRKGVTIGNRAIIGARAIVDTDVPDDGLVKAVASNMGD